MIVSLAGLPTLPGAVPVTGDITDHGTGDDYRRPRLITSTPRATTTAAWPVITG